MILLPGAKTLKSGITFVKSVFPLAEAVKTKKKNSIFVNDVMLTSRFQKQRSWQATRLDLLSRTQDISFFYERSLTLILLDDESY